MKNSILWFVPLMFVVFLFSCNRNSSEIDPEIYLEFQNKGAGISKISQTTLLANVAKAIQKGGPEYAVEFCNLNVSGIIDSLNGVNNCTISRVSAKNRNSNNRLSGKQEKEIWGLFENTLLTDTLIQNSGKLIYYKPIKIGMPACLKCHGNPLSEIDSTTLRKIERLYPDDLATGYKLKDFRGLWKIKFETNP